MATAIATHCLDISEPKTSRGLVPGYGLYTARRALSDLPARRPPTPADPCAPAAPRNGGSW
ncbi:hypothetical protein [Streptomyces olivaceoviridis]